MSYIYHQVTILVYEILIKNMYYQHTTKEWNNYDIVNNYNIVNNHNIVTKYMDKLIFTYPRVWKSKTITWSYKCDRI